MNRVLGKRLRTMGFTLCVAGLIPVAYGTDIVMSGGPSTALGCSGAPNHIDVPAVERVIPIADDGFFPIQSLGQRISESDVTVTFTDDQNQTIAGKLKKLEDLTLAWTSDSSLTHGKHYRAKLTSMNTFVAQTEFEFEVIGARPAFVPVTVTKQESVSVVVGAGTATTCADRPCEASKKVWSDSRELKGIEVSLGRASSSRALTALTITINEVPDHGQIRNKKREVKVFEESELPQALTLAFDNTTAPCFTLTTRDFVTGTTHTSDPICRTAANSIRTQTWDTIGTCEGGSTGTGGASSGGSSGSGGGAGVTSEDAGGQPIGSGGASAGKGGRENTFAVLGDDIVDHSDDESSGCSIAQGPSRSTERGLLLALGAFALSFMMRRKRLG